MSSNSIRKLINNLKTNTVFNYSEHRVLSLAIEVFDYLQYFGDSNDMSMLITDVDSCPPCLWYAT